MGAISSFERSAWNLVKIFSVVAVFEFWEEKVGGDTADLLVWPRVVGIEEGLEVRSTESLRRKHTSRVFPGPAHIPSTSPDAVECSSRLIET